MRWLNDQWKQGYLVGSELPNRFCRWKLSESHGTMRTNRSQTFLGEESTNRFLLWVMLLAFLLLLVFLAFYHWLGSPVELEIELSRSDLYTSRGTRFIVVEDIDEFPEIITVQMSRWQAWQFDRKAPIYVVDENSRDPLVHYLANERESKKRLLKKRIDFSR